MFQLRAAAVLIYPTILRNTRFAALLFLLNPVFLAVAEPPEFSVEVSLVAATGPGQGASWQGVLHLRSEGRERTVPITGGPSVVLKLPAGSTWTLEPEIKGFWSPGLDLSAGAPGGRGSERLPLWPTAVVRGVIRLAEPGGKMPQRITATLEAPPGPSAGRPLSKGRAVCPVDPKGEVRCELPAARLDLALRPEGFVPVYRWGIDLKAGKETSLGTVVFKKGASLKGWAVAEEGTLIRGKGIARLIPLLGPGGGGVATVERLERASIEAPLLAEGFFQIQGVAPGSYRLEVVHPGYTMARVFPVDVWAGAETALKQPVALRRPLRLEVSLSPPQDWLGKPWEAQVLKAADFSAGFEPQPAFSGSADPSGRIVVPDQAPGSYWLRVKDSLGAPLLFERFEVNGPGDAKQEFTLNLITVEGRLMLGREPLAGTLYFGGVRGAVSVKMDAGPKGEFLGVLPREGTWTVDVESADGRVRTVVKPKIKADRLGRASVKITIPDTRIFGKVQKEDGTSASAAEVVLLTDGDSIRVETDPNGQFELLGTQPGLAQVSARLSTREGLWSSDLLTLVLAESQPAGPVELRLRRMKLLRGKVAGVEGPVAGAGVVLQPLRPPLAFGNATRTSLDGSFQAEIPAGAESIVAVVSPPGFALKAFEVPVDGVPVILNVPREGGELEFVLPYSKEEAEDLGLAYVVFQNGLPLPFQQLLPWTRGHGQPYYGRSGKDFLVPSLAPGDYRVCVVPRDSLAAWGLTQWSQGGECATGALAPGARLRLEVERSELGARRPASRP